MKHAIRHIHFVGIGGSGMSGIAEILLNLGYVISGSDLADSATLQRLAGLGIQTHVGHAGAHVAGADAVVTSTAVQADNPEVMAADLDDKTFNAYFNRRYGQNSNLAGLTPEQLLQNLGLGDGRELNLAGLLLFGKQPQRYRPAFEVKAVAFPGTALHDSRYLDSEDIDGTLLEQYQRSFAFIRRNLRHVQAGRSFNTLGQLEIPEQVLEELLVNALIHRDYFTGASIRLMLFARPTGNHQPRPPARHPQHRSHPPRRHQPPQPDTHRTRCPYPALPRLGHRHPACLARLAGNRTDR